MSKMVGRFELADGATLFLDEIGDLPLEVQAKLLRVLDEGCFERLGSTTPVRVNVRILAATNRDLVSLVQVGRFRSDLFYRLNVFPINIPPLRERPEDIKSLAWAFTRQFEKEMGKQIKSIPKSSHELLLRYPWPGNARELRNLIERAMILASGGILDVRPPTLDALEPSHGGLKLREVERVHILSVLQKSQWRVAGKGGAAEVLGLKPTTLEARMKKLGIHRHGK
jgi:transcriptional regulator with GAF, ATPase, and Fis domain